MSAASLLHRPARSAPRRPVTDPVMVNTLYGLPEEEQEAPDPIEWVVSDRYLDRPRLYPRQATLLKLIFLRDDMLTDYDYEVLDEWTSAFRRTGEEGVQPDIYRRMRICKEQGRPWVREVVAPIGRRGSKGHLGALASSYVLWRYMHRPGGPQEHYGIDRDKRLTALVFAGKREQARANQWQDLVNIVVGGPCFGPYISRHQTERLTVFAPSDALKVERQALRGVVSEADLASFEIVPRESTLMAGRGPTSFMQLYDEWAHVVATGANRSAEDVWTAATPSLDQFGADAFIWEGSSPWQMTGQFYRNWQHSLALEPDGSPSYPEILMLQLPSWGLYQDWERAHELVYRPPTTTMIEVLVERAGRQVPAPVEVVEEGLVFQRLHGPIQTYDHQMRQLEKANPETFAVERRAHWAAVLGAYLNKQRVEEVFRPWGEHALAVQRYGRLATMYVAHGDPADVGDRFGFAIAHVEVEEAREVDPERGEEVTVRRRHVVFDVLDKWEAQEWADEQIHYVSMHEGDRAVEDEMWDYIRRFQPAELTFDQAVPLSTVQTLQTKSHGSGLPKRTEVYEDPATAPANWIKAECFKAAVNMGRVHAPRLRDDGEVNEASEIAELELRFLQRKGRRVDHPTSGPVQSKDVADCMIACCWQLIGVEIAELIGESLADLSIRGVAGRGLLTAGSAERAHAEHDSADLLSGLTARGRGPNAHPSGPRGYGHGRQRATGRAGWGRR